MALQVVAGGLLILGGTQGGGGGGGAPLLAPRPAASCDRSPHSRSGW